MLIPVLATKLFTPRPRPGGVLRAALIARLNGGLQRRLTLISAPAGFGKTSLVASWLFERMQAEGRRMKPGSAVDAPPASFAWLSLEEGDSDQIRFLTYLVAALQTTPAPIGPGVVGTGPVLDQAALYGLLKHVRDLGLPLISVSPLED